MPREYQVISTHDHIIEPPASSTAVSPRSSRIGRRSSRLDADGILRLADRTKEMYIRGGYNVYPVEVEAVLHEHPKVDLVAVVGVPDEVFSEKGTAFVVPTNPAAPPSADEPVRSWRRASPTTRSPTRSGSAPI